MSNKKFYKTILLATDLTEGSQKVAQKALALSQEYNAALYVIHAIEKMPVCAFGYTAIAEIEQEIYDEAKQRMSNLGAILKLSDDNMIIEKSHSKVAIISKAKELKADLIIVGSHGHHGIFSSLGSTATAVVNDADCDVLVIRHQEVSE